MTEEENITINKDEVAKVEQEIVAKEAAEKAQIQKETEEKVRAEIEQQRKLEEQQKALEDAQKQLEAAKKEAEEAKAASEELIRKQVEERLERELATSKQVRSAQNPLNVQAPKEEFKVEPENLQDIEKESRRAFFESRGISPRGF